MPADDDHPDDRGSSLLDLGESFLNAFGSGVNGTEWRDEVEDALGGEGEVDYDRLATAGIAAGEQIARLREQARAAPTSEPQAPPSPPIETRDIYDTDGEYAGTRVYVSAPEPNAYLSADGSEVVIRTGDTGETVALPQPATGLVTDEDGPLGGMELFVAYPEGSVLADAADELDGDDTDDEPDAPDSGLDPDTDMKWVDETKLDGTEGGDE